MESAVELEKELLPVIEGMGFSLVEFSISRHRGSVRAGIILYKEGGISLDDLSEAQKILRPRLELEFDRENLSLEISSPGISRKIKSEHEYDIFKGRDIRILVEEDWLEGVLEGLDGHDVLVNIEGEQQRFSSDDIRKAKLQ